tara:strand:+ start:1478 stop:1900 length:423 start_codon:yes stop_codon:yes gene_type:complete
MSTYSQVTASPKYSERASSSVPSSLFPNQTLRLASLGSTSVAANVNLQASLSRQVPSINFSSETTKIPQRRASVPRAIDIGRVEPSQFNRENIFSFGQSLGKADIFKKGAAFGFIGDIQGANIGTSIRKSLGLPEPTIKS